MPPDIAAAEAGSAAAAPPRQKSIITHNLEFAVGNGDFIGHSNCIGLPARHTQAVYHNLIEQSSWINDYCK
ncbi:unnamed protein product [Sympodiomycopsis kandeliae]